MQGRTAPVKRQFTHDDKIVELVGFNLFAGGQHPQRDGQIETGAFLFHIGGREIDGGAAHREFEAGVGQGGGDAVPRFLHRGVRQTDNHNQRVTPTSVDLNLDRIRLNAMESRGTDPG